MYVPLNKLTCSNPHTVGAKNYWAKKRSWSPRIWLLLTIESKGKPSEEEFWPELNQNQQIQLKPEKKRGKPSHEELFLAEIRAEFRAEFRQELNQNQQIQPKPKKKRVKPSHEELFLAEIRAEIRAEFRQELNQNQQIQLKPKKKRGKPFCPESNQN